MSPEVQPEEVQAILQAVQPTGAGRGAAREVAPRDFGKPLRLSRGALDDLSRRLRSALSACEKELGRQLRGARALELVELAEESAEGLFDELAAPFALLRFEVDGQPGWARWDVAGAVAEIETALGAAQPIGAERALSGVERRLLGTLLGGLVQRLAQALDLTLGDLRVVEKPEEIGTWRDGGATADRQRVRAHLSLEGPSGTSGIDLHLPGLSGAVEGEREQAVDRLPEHLAGVALELTARLGASDVPLDELLRLEEGDVIPLSGATDGLLRVLVEDVECASARLGCRDGRLAIQIERVGPADEDRESSR